MSRYAEAHDDIQALLKGIPISHPRGRFTLVRFSDAGTGRDFVGRLDVTSVAELESTPPSTVRNVAFTRAGLEALGLARRAMQTFPPDFAQGMARRAATLGDVGPSAPKNWEPHWEPDRVHAWVGCYARDDAALDRAVDELEQLAGRCSVTILGRQDVHRLVFERDETRLYIGEQPPISRNGWVHEHFGFADGVSNPPILGLSPDRDYPGRGKQDKPNGPWRALAAGEFVLGCVDEAGEYAPSPRPWELARHGSFMVYRKLSQKVVEFHRYMSDQAALHRTSPDRLAEKMIGRHRDGVPLVPRRGDSLNDFVYEDDPDARHCPFGAHARRANPRDQLGFGTPLVNRHRVLRRAITYGDYLPPPRPGEEHDPDYLAEAERDRGLIFITLGNSIEQQFEFVQQQWVNTGNELGQGNTRDPIIGNQEGDGGMVIPGHGKEATVICSKLPRFVQTRGGDYFFLPGISALGLIVGGSLGEPHA